MKHHHLYTIERRNARLQVRAMQQQVDRIARSYTAYKYDHMNKMEKMIQGIMCAYNLHDATFPVRSHNELINIKRSNMYLRAPKRRIRSLLTTCGLLKVT